ncbi:hypothetical protein JXI42_12965 [bacterium]|nr:hypothetical protein [bacterium]
MFSNICKYAEKTGINLTPIYILDAFGAVAGGILSLFLIGSLSSSLVIVITASVVMLLLFFIIRRKSRFIVLVLAILLAGFAFRATESSRQLERLLWSGYQLESYNSKYGKIQLLQREGERYLYESGTLVASSTDTLSIEAFVHTSMLIHPDPENVLLVGGLLEGSINEVLKHNPASITYLELDPMILKIAKKHFPRAEEVLTESNVNFILADTRFWIKRTADHFDVIMLSLPNPNAGVMNRFYTREFFEEVRKKLDVDGVFTFRLSVGANYLSTQEQMMTASIMNSMKAVFVNTQIYYSESNLIIMGSDENNLDWTAEDFLDAVERRGVSTWYFRGNNLYYSLEPFRQVSAREMIESRLPETSPNLDFSPIAYFFALQDWTKISGGGNFLQKLDDLKAFHWFLFVFMIFLLVNLLNVYIFGRKFGILVLVVVGGFGGIVTELIVLYLFQAVFGYLYWLVGFLTSVHMLGHVVGPMLYKVIKSRFSFRKWSLCWIGFVLLMLFIFNFTGLYQHLGYASGIAVFFGLQLFAGLLTGMLFPMGVRWMANNLPFTKNKGGLIYGLDCLGAGIGSFLAGLCFIPLFGVTGSIFAWLVLVVFAFPFFI